MEAQTTRAVERLDLEPIMVKLMDQKDGEGWTLERAQATATEYRRFLALCREYPSHNIVPYGDLDTFWHYHILDTAKYAEDCDTVFGYFLHHFPYLGMRGENDAQLLRKAFAETQRLYQEAFGTPYGATTDATSCSGQPCGNRCTQRCSGRSASTMEDERPRLAAVA